MHRTLALAAATLLVTGAASAQSARDSTFTWSGRVAGGGWLRVHNLNGEIKVEAAEGDQVEVRADMQARRGGELSDVRIVTKQFGSDVVICALWHPDATCEEDGADYPRSRNRRNRDGDVSVDFTVRLPRAVKVAAHTVNGGVDVRGARAEVEAHTVNGRVDATTSAGPVDASTVNGTVRVRMESLSGSGDMKFRTVNGAVTVEAPAQLDAEVEMETVNGGLRSDYPLTVQGKMSPRHLRATIGKGGRRISMSTVNGSIELRKL
jgi:hypothetical protein